MSRIAGFLAILAFSATAVTAQIKEWTGRILNTDYRVVGSNIEILNSGAFKFQSTSGGSLAAIDNITIPTAIAGTVTVHIERDPNDVGMQQGLPGATNVGLINRQRGHRRAGVSQH